MEGQREEKRNFFNKHSLSICSICFSYILEMGNQIRHSPCSQKAYSLTGETVQQIQFAFHHNSCHHSGEHWSHDQVEVQGLGSPTKDGFNFAIFLFPYATNLIVEIFKCIESYIVWLLQCV